MAFDYINEAFKKLALIEESAFNNSVDGINQLSTFMDEDDDTIRVIDPEAEYSDDVQDSYIGKVIVNCNICHSHIFENKEELVIDEEGNVNSEKSCPYCGEQEGFVIVGEITPYNATNSNETSDISSDVMTESLLNPLGNLLPNLLGEDQEEDKAIEDNDTVDEALGIGAGLALGGAAIGAGNVISKLMDSVETDSEDETLNEDSVDEGLLGDINLSIDGSNSSVGFLGGSASTKNEQKSRASRRCSLDEEFKEVSITTEDQKLSMTSDNNGKVTVTTEPNNTNNESEESSYDVISPISDETQDEILSNNDVDDTETTSEDSAEETNLELDEVDEKSLDELGESYLKKIYENVSSFKTTDVFTNDHSVIVEGVIKFNSGVSKKTGFIFEAKDANSKGQVRFSGFNKHLTESKDAFTLVGHIDNKKLFVESLKYNYKVNNNTVRGIVRRK